MSERPPIYVEPRRTGDDASPPRADPENRSGQTVASPAAPASPPDGFDSGCREAAFGPQISRVDTLVILLLTAVADICLFRSPGGTGAAVLLACGLVALTATAPPGKRLSIPVAVALLAAAAAGLWYSWSLSIVVGFLALIVHAVKLHRPQWQVTELILMIPATLAVAPLRLIGHLRPLRMRSPGDAAHSGRRKGVPWWVMVTPVAVTVVFILIFSAANPVVEKFVRTAMEQIGEWLREFFRMISPWRIFTWLLWLMFFAGLIRPLVKSQQADRLAARPEGLGPSGTAAADPASYSAALSTLIAVNMLFLLFNGLDSVYLYFKAALPEGISYSTYSREGCFWLTMALALSTFVIGAIFKGGLNSHKRKGVLHTLSYIWAGQNALLAIGALRRLQMYIGYNGLTRLRIVGIYGVILVVIGLAFMMWKVARRKRFLWLLRRDMLAFWTAAVILAVTPRDWVCSTYNVSQVMAGNPKPLTLLHGQKMSPGSYPPLIPLLDYEHKGEDKERMEATVRKGIAGLLGRQLVQMESKPPRSWTDWQGSRAWALRRLKAVEDRLDTTAQTGFGSAEKALRDHTRRWW